MKILVTGGTGFTGTALVRRLLSDGHSVVVLDYKEGLSANELKRRGAEVILGSVTSRDVVARAMQGVEVVHHLAAAFRELNVPEKHYYEVNVEGTRNVLDCRRARRRAEGRLLQHLRRARQHRRSARRRERADPAGRLLPANEVRSRAVRARVEPPRIAHDDLAPGRHLRPRRPRAVLHDLQARRARRLPDVRRRQDALSPALHRQPRRRVRRGHAARRRQRRGVSDRRRELHRDRGARQSRRGRAGRDRQHSALSFAAADRRRPRLRAVCKPFGVTPPIFPRRVDWYRQNRAFDIRKAKRDLGYKPPSA